MVVPDTTLTLVAATPPKATVAVSVKPVPVMVTAAPAVVVPESGLIDVTVGGP